MRAVVVHSLPGRVRFRTDPGTLKNRNIAAVNRALTALPGVRGAAVNPNSGSILVTYDGEALSGDLLHRAILDMEEPGPAGKDGAGGGDLAWSYIGYQLFRFFQPPFLKPFFTVLSAIPYFLKGLRSLGGMRMDVPLLDASAVAASLAQGNVDSASTLMMLLKTGEYLEAWAKQRSRENLAETLSLASGPVWIRGDDGVETQIPYARLRQGDRIVLRSGGLIPVDGTILEGRALVNEAALTGEPLGIEKIPGGLVHAGTVIEEGELIASVGSIGENTRYERIIRLIEDSEGARADTEIRANRIADRAVPFTFAVAALTWLFSGNPGKAASVLSVDYSCAVKLSTPLAFLAAIREGLGSGVFFKGGAPLEKLAGVDTVVFDKTGTLTRAVPAVAGIIPYNGYSEKTVLKIAACLEEHFPHPVARAVVAEALDREVRHREEHSSVKYIAAHGIASEYQGKHTVIGSRHFIGEDEGIDLSVAGEDEERAAGEGFSVLYLAREGKLAGLILIRDPLREEAAEVIAMLRGLGIRRIYLLSGDNKKTAGRITRELSLDGGLGELLPQDKTAIIKRLRERGCSVAFVGDGMNDSPAMSAANVGIAMKDGADIAREVADITLGESSLYPLVIARLLARRVMKRIRGNIGAAISLNSLFILMGLADKAMTAGSSRSVWLHNLTTLALSMNAMRPLLPEAGK